MVEGAVVVVATAVEVGWVGILGGMLLLMLLLLLLLTVPCC